MVIEFISLLLTMAAFLFLKGMMGAWAPFSYLVNNIFPTQKRCLLILSNVDYRQIVLYGESHFSQYYSQHF